MLGFTRDAVQNIDCLAHEECDLLAIGPQGMINQRRDPSWSGVMQCIQVLQETRRRIRYECTVMAASEGPSSSATSFRAEGCSPPLHLLPAVAFRLAFATPPTAAVVTALRPAPPCDVAAAAVWGEAGPSLGPDCAGGRGVLKLC